MNLELGQQFKIQLPVDPMARLGVKEGDLKGSEMLNLKIKTKSETHCALDVM